MLKKIVNNKLFKDSFIYVIADVINKAIPFLLLPVLTYYLSPEDYGVLASYTSLIGILAIFIGLSIHGAISVNYYKLNKPELAKYIGNVTYILASSFLTVNILLWFLKSYLSIKLNLNPQWLFLGAFQALAVFLVTINLSLWIVEQKPKYYGGYQIGETLFKLGLSLYFVIILSMSWEGRAYGMFIGSMLSALLSIIFLYKRGYLKMKYHKSYIKDALYFGIPLIPHQLSFWLRSGAIIFILMYLVGEKETGLYNVGNQFVIPLMVLTAAFNKAWAPYLYRKLSDDPSIYDKKRIVKFTYLYFFGVLILALLLTLIAPLIINIVLNERFYNAHIYIIYLSFAAAFQGMYYMVVNYIFYTKKTKYLAYITFFSSIINVSLAYWLISINGAIGAAQAFLVASIISFMLVWFYSNKVYKMPWKMLL